MGCGGNSDRTAELRHRSIFEHRDEFLRDSGLANRHDARTVLKFPIRPDLAELTADGPEDQNVVGAGHGGDGISPRQADRLWAYTKAWLYERLSEN